MHLLLLSLLQALPAQHFPVVERPGIDAQVDSVLRAICSASPTNHDQLLRVADRFDDSLRTHSHDPRLWFADACIRESLYLAGVVSHEGPALPPGASWEDGSIGALVQSITLSPGDPAAADLLARLALDVSDPGHLPTIVAALDASETAGVVTPSTLRACSEFARRRGDTATVNRCAAVALARGVDSTWQLIRLARLRFGAADTGGGVRAFELAAATAHDSADRDEVTWQLQWFLTPEEEKEWESLAPVARDTWIRDRLASRDVRDGRPPGARLAAHFARLEYVEAHFRLDVPRKLTTALRTGPATREGGPSRCPIASCDEPGGVWADAWREYSRWQTDFDDRGIVWMRFGPPDEQRSWSCPHPHCDVVREAWEYHIDGREMLLSFENEAFDGSVSAARLVSGVLGSYFCGIDAVRCRLTSLSQADASARHSSLGFGGIQSASTMVHPEDIEAVRRDDRAAISEATTSDNNAPRDTRSIGTVAQLYREWNPATGEPLALLSYALQISDLAVVADTARVDATLRLWDSRSARRRDTTFVLRRRVGDDPAARSWIGFVAVPSLPGLTTWGFTVDQPGPRMGRAAEDPGVALDKGTVALSDIIVAATAAPLHWSIGGTDVAVSPYRLLRRQDTLQIYYQIRSDTSGTGRLTMSFVRADRGSAASRPALQLAFASRWSPGVTCVTRIADVSRLARGEYRLELRLDDGNGHTLITRRAPLSVQ